MRRLSQAGFKSNFVRPAILPDWWDDSCVEDPGLLSDVELRVARFLDLPLARIRDVDSALAPPNYPQAQLRRVRDIDRDRLAPAIHSALRIGAAVVRSLGNSIPAPVLPPADGIAWRERIQQNNSAITLDHLLGDLWQRGIPVIALDALPAPSFQGLACIVEDRPVILLGHRHDEPGRIAFLVAHEAGHIAAGDCAPEKPVVDEEEEFTDHSPIENRADLFATHVLVGDDNAPSIDGLTFKELATKAFELEQARAVDASAVLFAWARRTGDYAKASLAVRALFRSAGARGTLARYFDQYVDVNAAAESDRDLLRCVVSNPERAESAA